MTSTLPPAPPEDDDRERKWIIEGLRQALARATIDELARLTALLEPEADGAGNVAGWLVMLIADETGRDRPDDEAPGNGQSAGEIGDHRPAADTGNGKPTRLSGRPRSAVSPAR
jgi:hypothetical protein